MKKYIFVLPIIMMLFASCEKVVDIDLNNASSQYVVEGEVYEGMDTVKVHVAKTTDYYGRSPQLQINTATVILSDNEGNNTNIPLVADGKYELPNFTGIAGRQYMLKVTVDGREFTAAATMQQPVNIDSVSKEYKEADFRKEGYEVAARFTDPGSQTRRFLFAR